MVMGRIPQTLCVGNLPTNLNLTQDWQQLANKHDLRLPVCISTALARGVTGSNNASRHNLDSNNLADGFELVGLGEFATMLASSDKTIRILGLTMTTLIRLTTPTELCYYEGCVMALTLASLGKRYGSILPARCWAFC